MATRAQEPEDDDGSCRVYRGPVLLHRRRTFLVRRSFTEIPRGSNSIETRLSVVNCLTERRGNKNIIKVKGAREGGVASTHDR